MTKLRYTKLVH